MIFQLNCHKFVHNEQSYAGNKTVVSWLFPHNHGAQQGARDSEDILPLLSSYTIRMTTYEWMKQTMLTMHAHNIHNTVQKKLVNVVHAYNFPVLGPLTSKFGSDMHTNMFQKKITDVFMSLCENKRKNINLRLMLM